MAGPITTGMTCGTCAYSGMALQPNGVLDANTRVCKFNPPNCVAIPHRQGVEVRAFWPLIPANEWCHQHKRREPQGEVSDVRAEEN